MTAIEKYIATMKSTGRTMYKYYILSRRGGTIFTYSVWEYPDRIHERVKSVCESMKGDSFRIVEIN